MREPESAPSAFLSDSLPSESLPGDYTTICKLNIIHRCHSLRHISLKLILSLMVDVTHTPGMLLFNFRSGFSSKSHLKGIPFQPTKAVNDLHSVFYTPDQVGSVNQITQAYSNVARVDIKAKRGVEWMSLLF